MKKSAFNRRISFLLTSVQHITVSFVTAVSVLGVLFLSDAQAQLIAYEPFNYALDLVQPDPDGGVNGNNGLPYTNVGGTPTGTSVGLRTHYGSDHKVVAALSYSNNGGVLLTDGNALQRFSGTGNSVNDTKIYRTMTVDPFAAYRSEASADWLGWNTASGTKELYFSVLLNANSISTGVDNGLLMYVGFDNTNYTWRIVQSGTDWKFRHHDTSYKTLGAATANTTVFVVGRFTFTSATSTTIDLWFNPTLGSALGTPTATQTTTTTTSGGQFRSILTYNGTNIFTYDEFRMGVTSADVMPYTTNPTTGVEKPVNSRVRVYQSGQNQLTVNTPSLSTNNSVSLEVVDIRGISVFQQNHIGENTTVTALPAGVYFVRIVSAEGPAVQRVVVQ